MRLRDMSPRSDEFHLSDTTVGLVYEPHTLAVLVNMCDYDEDTYDKHVLRSMVIPEIEVELRSISQHYIVDTLSWLCAFLDEEDQRLRTLYKMKGDDRV